MACKTAIRNASILAVVILWCCETSGATTQLFNTSENRFDTDIDNQSWWTASGDSNFDLNDNYILRDDHRNFFTFDLTRLRKRALAATLQVRRYSYRGQETETIEFFDVTTDAATLNNNVGPNQAIYDDLGSGVSYGRFEVSSVGNNTDILSFSLNEDAVADINAAVGGFFSIGGVLLTAGFRDAVFSSSGGNGIQRLLDTIVPEPFSLSLILVSACVLIPKRRIRSQ